MNPNTQSAPLIAGDDLTGVECRALRTALGLERRHVSIFAEALGLDTEGGRRVMQWERSKGRGYPGELVDRLLDVDQAVQRLADDLADTAEQTGQIRRPLGHRRIFTLLDLGRQGFALSPEALEALDANTGETWHALMDAAIARALVDLRSNDQSARVVMDREPDPEG